jgi:hypothetical protein
MKNHKQLIIILVVLVIVALGAYVYFSRGKAAAPSPTNTLSSSNTGANPAALGTTEASASAFAGSDIAVLLKNISSIRLNTAVLSSPSFVALTDTSITLPPAALSGRTNPFSGGNQSSAATTTSATSTSANSTIQSASPR